MRMKLFVPIFFLAATAFGALPSTHLAGLVVRACLLRLHWMGFVCAALFLICSIFYNRLSFTVSDSGLTVRTLALQPGLAYDSPHDRNRHRNAGPER